VVGQEIIARAFFAEDKESCLRYLVSKNYKMAKCEVSVTSSKTPHQKPSNHRSRRDPLSKLREK